MKYSPTAPVRSLGSNPTHAPRRLLHIGKAGWLLATLAALILSPAWADVAAPSSPGTKEISLPARSTDAGDTRAPAAAAGTNMQVSLSSISANPNTQPIPYQTTPYFADNRVGGTDVKLPPLPSSLYPVPPPERKPLPVVLPRPGLLDPPIFHGSRAKGSKDSVATAKNNSSENGNNGPEAVAGTADTADQNIAVSPFITWITKNPDAGNVARQAQGEYSVSGVANNSVDNSDIFYNIRFPYTGSEQSPPGSSAVIYTTPKR